MADAIIENPILNSAFAEPSRHFRFSDDGITNEVVEARRTSTYFVPIPRARKRGGQKSFETEWTDDRLQPNKDVDRIRARVGQWRKGNYAGVTPVTRRLLDHWTNPDRENKLFFCQIEALETAIYIAECATKYGDAWLHDFLREANDTSNPGLPRVALKMATGAGKTVVMAMLIAWQALNKLANPQDARFTDSFLLVSPGITIRDRLRVLLPNVGDNYYRQRDITPADLREELNRARILITNFHAFQLKDQFKAARLTKKFVNPSQPDVFKESPGEMVRRVCKEFGNKKNVLVINDEAHHCYHRKPAEEKEKLTGDERREAEERNKQAAIWIKGIEAIKAKIGVRAIYDLSATPFFLRGSGHPEATLFPWVVSDFSLIDAIESGIVKVPRVPVSDDAMTGELPTYRDLWIEIKDALPKAGRGEGAIQGEPKLPDKLLGALHALYGNYEKSFQRWERSDAAERGQTPPVFIVVCNNTSVSKLVYDYVAGWEKPLPGGETVLVPGALAAFGNVRDGKWLNRPNTILVDSTQLESGEAMTADFKKIAATEIDEFKNEYRIRFPGRTGEDLTDEDILREVMNTVGKAGKLGEHVRCVVSVSMLTEGWDANTVTHILGVRAFGAQLLCEQVVGRGLRRTSYAADEQGMFEPEYAEVYGVPFSFIPCSGASADVTPARQITRVRALEGRAEKEITFPRLLGYRFELPTDRLDAKFDEQSRLVLTTKDIATWVEVAGIAGEQVTHNLDDLRSRREQEVVFALAKKTIEKYFTDEEGCARVDLFPQVLAITRRWLAECVQCKDGMVKQFLLLHERREEASDKIYRAIVRSTVGEPSLKPILRPYDTFGSTKYVDFDTTKPTYLTRPDKCHVSHVVADTESWEQKMAQTLESAPEVISYVKNQNLGFTIPYTINGEQRDYYPDFLVRLRAPDGERNLILEVSGQKRRDKEAKVSTAQTLWIPAVNNGAGLGRWAFLEVTDPWDCADSIRGAGASA